MNGFLDRFLVGVLLLAGFGYAIYALAPKSWRARLCLGAAALIGGLPVSGLRAFAERLAAAAARTGGACGGCGTCGSNDAVAARPDAQREVGRGAPQDGSEVRIPLSQVGRRR